MNLNSKSLLLDLYSGVGLFGLCLASEAGRVVMIEECPPSVKLAHYNAAYHQLTNAVVRSGRVEEELPRVDISGFEKVTAMMDPPRQGLSAQVAKALSEARYLDQIFYLSCHPESLVRDLAIFIEKGWRIQKVVPFDFFPRTQHLETLAVLAL